MRSALFERDNDAKKSEASFEELKDSIGGHLMAMYGQDMDALDVLKEFLLLTRVKFLLHNDGNRLNLEDIYRAGEKMITAMREHLPMKLSRGTMCEFSHSAKDHFDGEEVHIFLARLLKVSVCRYKQTVRMSASLTFYILSNCKYILFRNSLIISIQLQRMFVCM